uniref:translation initiation factor eIF2B subunit delta n=1 Tax=Myxine glutinosa TaxID=7769 RepID=UPI00358E0416
MEAEKATTSQATNTPCPQKKAQETSKMKEDGAEFNKEDKQRMRKEKRQQKKERKEGGRPLTESTTGGQKSNAPRPDGGDKAVVKADVRAERRAKQEAERMNKQNKKAEAAGSCGAPRQRQPSMSESKTKPLGTEGKTKAVGSESGSAFVWRISDHVQADDPAAQRRLAKKLEKQQVPQRTDSTRKVSLFSHLHQFSRQMSLTQNLQVPMNPIHPAIIQLGLQYAQGIIVGSNSRSIALLHAFKQVVGDYKTPAHEDLCRDLVNRLKPCISFLNQCRPLAVSMGNVIKQLKSYISSIPAGIPEKEAKRDLCSWMDNFVEHKIELAAKAIAATAYGKIKDGDTILVYGCSSLVLHVLTEASRRGRRFRVIVVDSRPRYEGRVFLRRLVRFNIDCSYILITAVAYILPEVSMVMLGAHGLLANGCVMSRVGSAQISLLARACNVPTLICCETYKFCDRVQTDAFVSNELDDPEELAKVSGGAPSLQGWEDDPCLNLLNLVYDITPPDFVAVVITDVGMIPCTSVPVVLRVKSEE